MPRRSLAEMGTAREGRPPLYALLRAAGDAMTANRKRIGDAAELREQRRLEANGWVVFPLSPSFAGVDIIAVRCGWVALVECKSYRLYGKARAEALRKLLAARQAVEAAGNVRVTCWLAEEGA